jgi:CheY-like chemotaxis protein
MPKMDVRTTTILLVEDDENDVLLIQRAFRKVKLSNPMQVVNDGEEAIAYLRGDFAYSDRERNPLPVMILLDLKLPRIGGHDVLKWLRSQEALKRIPVVVLTSSKESADVNRAYDLGANSYLVKPVQFEALINMVKNIDLYWLVMNENPVIGKQGDDTGTPRRAD